MATVKFDIAATSCLINDVYEAIDRSKVGPVVVARDPNCNAPIVSMIAMQTFETVLAAALPRVILTEESR